MDIHDDSVSISVNAKAVSGNGSTGSDKKEGDPKEALSGRYLIVVTLLEKMAEDQGKAVAKKGGGSSGNNMDKMVKESVRQIKEYFDILLNRSTGGEGGSAGIDTAQSSGQVAVPAQGQQGWGVQYTSVSTYTEGETTTFSGQGTVTAGGKELNFDVSLLMERSHTETQTTEVRMGDALRPPKDPLVVNLGAGPAGLSGQKIQFDINADGTDEQFAALVNTSGFLTIDKNGNGIVDNGSELFGPATNNGFSELAAYDEDKNGWIDEGDSAYSKLGVWTQQGGETNAYTSLKELNIGAIYTGSAETEFSLTNNKNETEAAVRRTGLYLREDGTAGTVQNLDFVI